jgi:hypothetical protein
MKALLMTLIALSIAAVPVVAGEKLPIIKIPPIKMPKLKIPELEGQKKSNVQQSLTNTAYGTGALASNTTGGYNTASGYLALYKNTTGRNNTASGYGALYYNTTGRSNTASGVAALIHNTTGDANTASGIGALYRNTTGEGNTASGYAALYNSTGSRNTAVGASAGASNGLGNNNVFIGYQAGNNSTYHNRSNLLVIAKGSTLDDELISGNFDTHVVDISAVVNVQSLTQASDGRLKKDIKPLTHALDAILQLQGKTYRWKEDATFANKKDIGLIAQEVEKVFPELVAENEQGFKGIAYSKLTAVLIEAIKEQQGQIATLQRENEQLKLAMAEQMDALLARVAMLEGVQVAAN